MSKILVTGSSGSIGTRLCEEFISRGIDFVGIDKLPNKWNSQINANTVLSDLRSDNFANELPKDIDTVIHLAANSRVNDLIIDPSLALDNFITLFNVLEYCRISKISKFLFSSSREVYGNIPKLSVKEDDVNLDLCESPYSASKLGGEAILQAYNNCFDLDFVIFRFSNVYGMYDESDRVIPVFLELCRLDKDIIVFGKDKVLDFIYIDDVIDSILSAIEKFDKIKNDSYNIAYGKGTKLVDLAQIIKSTISSKTKIIIKQNRKGEVMEFVGDISKSRRKLSFSPTISVKQGIIKAAQWYAVNGT